MQDVQLGHPAVDLDTCGDRAQVGLVGERADLEDEVPVGQVREGLDAGAVEGRLLGEGGAERDQHDLLALGGRGPLPGALGGAAVALAGADEGVRGPVDAVGVRLERPGDEDDAAARAALEAVDVVAEAVLGEPGRERRVVRPAALGRLQLGEHRLGHLLLVSVPSDQVRGERDGGDAPAVGEHGRRVGGDVVEHEVRLVALEGGGELRERLDGVLQEQLQVVDELGAPGLRLVVGREGGGVDDGRGAGLRDLLGEGGGDGVADAVAPRHEFADHLDARVHVPVGGDGEHGDVGGLRCGHDPTLGETIRLVQSVSLGS